MDIPTPDEIKVIITNAKGHWRPLLITAIFTGVRASELRGLRWQDVNLKVNELKVNELHVRQAPIGSMRSASLSQPLASAQSPSANFVANTLKKSGSLLA